MGKLAEQNKFEELNQLKAIQAEKNIPASVETYNSLFATLFEQHTADAAARASALWKDMESNNVSPNETTFSLYISGLAGSAGAHSDEALSALMAMKKPSADLCFRVFLPLVEQNQVTSAENLVEFMKKKNTADVRLYNLLLRLYLEEGDSTKIQQLLDQMKSSNVDRDSKTWALLIESCKNDAQRSAVVLKELEGVKVDATISSAKVSYYLSQSDSEKAEAELQGIVDRGETPEHFAYMDLLAHYSDIGDVKRAQRIFDLMKERNVGLTISHYHSLGSGYINKGAFGYWDNLQSELEQNGYSRTLDTYHLQMKRVMYDTDMSINDAEPLIEAMKQEGIAPSIDTWTLLMDGYCVIGDMESAHKTLDRMKADGIEPTGETYMSLITGYHQHGNIKDAAPLIQHFSALEAQEFLQEHKGKIETKE